MAGAAGPCNRTGRGLAMRSTSVAEGRRRPQKGWGRIVMPPKERIYWSVLRWLYGLFFLATGLWILVSVGTGMLSPPSQPTPRAAAFMEALSASGFMDPLLALSFILGGGALLARRTAPAGLAILAPAVAVILLFHLFLSGQWPVGLVVAGVFLALAWHYRTAFASLWSWQAKRQE
jgi:hypothetical protein